MGWWDTLTRRKAGEDTGGIVTGQGVDRKSANKREMDDIMNPNTNGGAGRGPNNGSNDVPVKKEKPGSNDVPVKKEKPRPTK